jgi:hypothetical protein
MMRWIAAVKSDGLQLDGKVVDGGGVTDLSGKNLQSQQVENKSQTK